MRNGFRKVWVVGSVVVLLGLLPVVAADPPWEWDEVPWKHSRSTPFDDFWDSFLSHFNRSEASEHSREWLDKWNERWRDSISEDWKERIRERYEEFEQYKWVPCFFGRLQYTDGLATGNFVRFIFDEPEGGILKYTVKEDEDNIIVFDSILVQSFVPIDSPQVCAALWQCRGDTAFLEVHDIPSAFLKIRAKKNDTKVVFNLGNTVSAATSGTENVVHITGELSGKLIIVDPYGDDETSKVTVTDGFVNLSLVEGSLVFYISDFIRGCSGISEELQEWIEDAVSTSRVGARIFVQSRNKSQNRTHVVVYSDMAVDCKAGKGTIVVNVSAEEEQGKTIVIDVDNETFNLYNLVVTYDEEPLGLAGNYSDILNPDDDNGTAEYLVVLGAEGVQILVSIPSFSSHTIVITEGNAPGEHGWEIIGIPLMFMIILLVVTGVLIAEVSMEVLRRR